MFLDKYQYPKKGKQKIELEEIMGDVDARLETQELTGQVGSYVGIDSKKEPQTFYLERKLYADGFGTEETNNIAEKMIRPFVDKISSKKNRLFINLEKKQEIFKKSKEELLNIEKDIYLKELDIEDLKKRINNREGENITGEMKYRLEIKKEEKERKEKEIEEIKNEIENLYTDLEKTDNKVNN